MLATLNELKDHLGAKAATTQIDDEATAILAGVSQQILEYIGRSDEVVVKERTQTLDLARFQTRVVLPAAPLHAVSSVRYDYDREFAAASEVETYDYDWQSEKRRRLGILEFRRSRFRHGEGVLRVTWVGGFSFDADAYLARQDDPPSAPATGDVYLAGAAPTGAWSGKANQLATWSGSAWTFETAEEHLVARLPDLKLACLLQSGFLYQTRRFQGTQQATSRNASVTVRSIGIIHPVRELLANHVRRVIP